MSGRVSARPKANMAITVVTAPSSSDTRRPQRSATAPVGTSASVAMSQKGDSMRATWPTLRPRSSSRKAMKMGIRSHISESSLNT